MSQLIFKSENQYSELRFSIKIQYLILTQKPKFAIFSIFILLINSKSKHTFDTWLPNERFFSMTKKGKIRYKLFSILYLDHKLIKSIT